MSNIIPKVNSNIAPGMRKIISNNSAHTYQDHIANIKHRYPIKPSQANNLCIAQLVYNHTQSPRLPRPKIPIPIR